MCEASRRGPEVLEAVWSCRSFPVKEAGRHPNQGFPAGSVGAPRGQWSAARRSVGPRDGPASSPRSRCQFRLGGSGIMQFVKLLALRGPNMWANFPVLEAWVDLGALKDSPSTSIPGFNDRLVGWLPTMI